MNTTFISIITVTFADIEGLKNTCESIYSQEYESYEHIVVDGGSVDGTIEYISGIKKNNLKFVSERDKGIYDAMNKGIDMSKGKYLMFLNSGDCLFDKSVLKNLSKILDNGYDIVYGDTVEKEIDGDVIYKKARSYKTYWYSMFAHHQSMLFSRKIIGSKKYNIDFISSSDYALVSTILKENPSVKYISSPISMFLQGGLSTRLNNKVKIYKDRWFIKRNIIGMNFFAVSGVIVFQMMTYVLRLISQKAYYRLRGMKKQ